MFLLSRFFSANRRFVGGRANNFWQYSKHSFRKFNKFVELWHLVYFNTGLVRNLGHINVFLEHWAQLFKENLGTHRLTIKLEGTQGYHTVLITESYMSRQPTVLCSVGLPIYYWKLGVGEREVGLWHRVENVSFSELKIFNGCTKLIHVPICQLSI